MEYTDKQIREMADEAGFLDDDEWWEECIPEFGKFLELANILRISNRYIYQPDKNTGGKTLKIDGRETERKKFNKSAQDHLKSIRKFLKPLGNK